MGSVIFFYWILQWFKLKNILISAGLMMRHMHTLLRWNLYHVALLTVLLLEMSFWHWQWLLHFQMSNWHLLMIIFNLSIENNCLQYLSPLYYNYYKNIKLKEKTVIIFSVFTIKNFTCQIDICYLDKRVDIEDIIKKYTDILGYILHNFPTKLKLKIPPITSPICV
jgi:hypothetical protein